MSFSELNAAGLLAIGLKPEWVDQTAYTNPPALASAGVYLQDSPRAIAYVAAREDVHRRTARVKIDVFDLTVTVYTFNVSGTVITYDASVQLPATNALLVSGIAAVITAAVPAVVFAETDPDDADTILIVGVAADGASWYLDATTAGGVGAVSSTIDAESFDVRLYTTPGGIVKTGSTGSPERWVSPPAYIFTSNTWHGFEEPVDVGGRERMYIEVSNLAKHASDGASVVATIASVMVGPAVLEATT